jgi:hypothetical protein
MAVGLDLKANPDPVVIDTANEVGTTTIEYWKHPDHRLWCRDRPGPAGCCPCQPPNQVAFEASF